MIKYIIIFVVLGFFIGRQFKRDTGTALKISAAIAIGWALAYELIWGLAAFAELYAGIFIQRFIESRENSSDRNSFRIESLKASQIADLYCSANSDHYKSNNSTSFLDYEGYILNFLNGLANQPIPPFGVDLEKKKIQKDISTHALSALKVHFREGNGVKGRETWTDAINALLKLVFGSALYELLEECYLPSLGKVISPYDALSESEKNLLSECQMRFLSKAINAGLVKP
jgi:hypothetical protein